MAAPDRGASPSEVVDVVIVGNGPSAMILSYILHGNIPRYKPRHPHPDPLLHDKLKDAPHLLDLDVPRLTDHFEASRFSYSTQALPVNSLLDALVRPGGEVEDPEASTCVEWRHVPEKTVPHLILGNAVKPGGQWTECPPDTKWDIQSLSYAGMLSLPGYSFYDHHRRVHGADMPPFTRPSRREISDYLAAYPAAVGIGDVFRSGETVGNVTRERDGFYIGSHNIRCKSLVLASGIFTEPKTARPLLQPLLRLDASAVPLDQRAPLLVIGSGFSAADIIISAPPHQKIIHIFKWEPETKPSPLKGCHQRAYPEYAGVYRLMKRSATAAQTLRDSAGRVQCPPFRPGTLTPFLESRQWDEIYEGLPNTRVMDVTVKDKGQAEVSLCMQDGTTFTRPVSGLSYAVGRRGSLNYLDNSLREEIIRHKETDEGDFISARTLRAQALADLEVAKDVFVIGSLTGDSLIRFAYGGCVYVAGKLMARKQQEEAQSLDVQGGQDAACTANGVERGRQGNSPGGTVPGVDNGDVRSCDSVDEKRKSRKERWWPSCLVV
ncbi:hypothetical protein VTO42DRAFT_1839 [Malbranchea cinnamomea]